MFKQLNTKHIIYNNNSVIDEEGRFKLPCKKRQDEEDTYYLYRHKSVLNRKISAHKNTPLAHLI